MSDDTQNQQPEEQVQEEVQTQQTEEPKAESAQETTAPAEEPKKEAKPATEAAVAGRQVSANLQTIIESIEKLSVLELADLVKALESRFGVTAGAPIAAAAAAPATPAEAGEEKTTFNVILANSGANKIGAIKAVRELVPTLGLKEAKDLVEAAPKPVLEGVNKATAEEAKAKLTAAGATVELQ